MSRLSGLGQYFHDVFFVRKYDIAIFYHTDRIDRLGKGFSSPVLA